MRICIVTNEPFPQSIRLEKEIRTFQDLKYEIHVVCFTEDGQPKEDVILRAAVHRIRAFRGFIGRMFRLIFKILFIDVQLFWKLRLVVKRYNIHVLFVRDLSFVLTACLIGKFLGNKVIYDVNDRYPLAVNSWGLKRSWNERLLNSPRRMARLERRCLEFVDHIVVSVPPYVDHFIQMGIPRAKITLLPNYIDLAHLDRLENKIRTYSCNGLLQSFTIVYAGSFGRHRGLDVAIKTMPFLTEQIADARLVLIGPLASGEMLLKQEFEELAVRLGVSEHIIWTGPLEFAKVLGYVRASDVCIIPFKKSDHTNTILAHKLFEYMSQCKPVVTTDVGLCAWVVETEKCGIVVAAEDPLEMAEAFIKLHDNPSYAAEFGKQGRKAVETKFNWTQGSKDFVAYCRQLEDACRFSSGKP